MSKEPGKQEQVAAPKQSEAVNLEKKEASLMKDASLEKTPQETTSDALLAPAGGETEDASSNSDAADLAFKWRFHRIGGLDQVTFDTAEEIRHLRELDPKLWVVLSCPIHGLQFDQRTLELLDSDHDGKIRVQEVVDGVEWVCQRLKDPGCIKERLQELPLDRINQDIPEGAKLYSAAQALLESAGKADSGILTREDLSEAVLQSFRNECSGDGIIVPNPDEDAEMASFISDVMHCCGSAVNSTGQSGVTIEMVKDFLAQAKMALEWNHELEVAHESFPLGEATAKAYSAMEALESKIKDYFLRCELAAFDASAEVALNPGSDFFTLFAQSGGDAQIEALEGLPPAKIKAGRPLPLSAGVNPVMRARMEKFKELVVVPFFGKIDELTIEQWKEIQSRFADFKVLYSKKPDCKAMELDSSRLESLSDGKLLARFEKALELNLSAKEHVGAIRDLERLLLYHANIHQLLLNFVSFCDFYALRPTTTFMAGQLYMDGRTYNLCLPIGGDIKQHASRAKFSRLSLIYCACTRPGCSETFNIVAAVTEGNADLLTPGRHGVYIDTKGQSWDATLVHLEENPISLRTAVMDPYRRLARTAAEQLQKFAINKQVSVMGNASKKIQDVSTAKQPFDLSKSMGVFAALGLAVGAIGTALASIASALMSMPVWQLPLLLLGAFILISGPSVALAWFKLRQRTLGPVLDASGWAVNSQIPVNFMMGRHLTHMASLPHNSVRSLNDPFQPPKFWKPWMSWVTAIGIILVLAFCSWWGWSKYQDWKVAQAEKVEAIAEKANAKATQKAVEAKKAENVATKKAEGANKASGEAQKAEKKSN